MKKWIVGIIAMFMVALTSKAQEITFINLNEDTYPSGEVVSNIYDFGNVEETGGHVSTKIEFINTGKEQLIISNIRKSCGCVQVNWKSHPIASGGKGYINVYFNPIGRPGKFRKTITVESNAKQEYKCYVQGEVIPKQVESAELYPIRMGELSLKAKDIDFGIIKKGQKERREIEYANITNHEINIELATLNEEFLTTLVTLQTIKPNETGKFYFMIDPNACKMSGSISTSVLVVINKDKIESDEYKITLKAEIDDGSSRHDMNQKQ